MTKQEFRQALKRNAISCDEFALLTGVSVGTIYRYGCSTSIPFSARLILRLLDERGGVSGLIRRKTC